mgnify:CR=1 FL=1
MLVRKEATNQSKVAVLCANPRAAFDFKGTKKSGELFQEKTMLQGIRDYHVKSPFLVYRNFTILGVTEDWKTLVSDLTPEQVK